MINLKKLFQQGGRGSGNFGHKGRPGRVGGSGPGGGSASDSEWLQKRLDRFNKKAKERAMTTKGIVSEYKLKKVPEVNPEYADVEKVGGHLNLRTLGQRGAYGVHKDFGLPSVGDDVDFYDALGDKQYGQVIELDPEGGITFEYADQYDDNKTKRLSLLTVDAVNGWPVYAKGI